MFNIWLVSLNTTCFVFIGNMKKVVLGNFDELLEAITQTGPFEICSLDESTCMTAPGWGSWPALILVAFEMLFWGVSLYYLRKKLILSKAQKKFKKN